MTADFLLTGGALRSRVAAGALDVLGVAPLAVGTRLGAFQIDALIGAGGGGCVYLASRVGAGFQQKVALKVLDGDPEHARSAAEEAGLLATLSHPHIAHVYDAGVLDDGGTWFAMEFVDGEPIDAYCRRQLPTLSARLALLAEVCGTVAFAHAHGVIHRDIKPQNVLVDAEAHPKLLDFGIATRGADALAPGTHACTRAVASPEQLARRPVSTSSDIYQLGRLLQACCADDTLARDARQRAQAPLLQRIIARATATQPTARYPSAAELGDDLRRLAALQPPQGVARDAGAAVRLFLARQSRGFLWLLLILAGLIGTLAFSAWQDQRAGAALRDQRALDLQLAERTQSFLADLLDEGRVSGEPSAGALAQLDIGAARARQLVERQPGAAVTAGAAVAEAYLRAGARAQAIALLQQLGADLQSLWPTRLAERAQLAISLMRIQGSIGSLADLQAAVADAEALARAAQIPAESLDWLMIGRTRVIALDRAARPREALAEADRLLAEARGHGLALSSQYAGMQFTRGMIRWYSLDDDAGLDDLAAAVAALRLAQGDASSYLSSTSFLLAGVQAFAGDVDQAGDMLAQNRQAALRLHGEDAVEALRARAADALFRSDWRSDDTDAPGLATLQAVHAELAQREPDAMFTLDIGSGLGNLLLDRGEAAAAKSVLADIERNWRRRVDPNFVFLRLAEIDHATARCVADADASALRSLAAHEGAAVRHRLLSARLALRRAQCHVALGQLPAARAAIATAQRDGVAERWNARERRLATRLQGAADVDGAGG